MFASRHIMWLVGIRYRLYFAAARGAITSAGLGSGGKRILASCLDLVPRTNEKGLGISG